MFADEVFATLVFLGKVNMKKFFGMMMCICALSFVTFGATGCKDTKKSPTTKTTTSPAAATT